MNFDGERQINADRETVFAALNDPEVLRQSIPGCESLEKTSDTSFAAKVGLKVGPVRAAFTGEVDLEDLNPPESYTITGKGKGGAAGFAKGTAKVHLAEKDGGTLLTYTVSVDLGGKIAQLGSRLVTGTANRLSGEFFDTFSDLAEGAAPEADTPAPVVKSADVPEATPAPAAIAAQETVGTPAWIWWAVGGIGIAIAAAILIN